MKKRKTKECGFVYENDFSEEHIHMNFYPKFNHIDIFSLHKTDTNKVALFTIDLTDEASEKLAKDIKKSMEGD